MTYNTCSSFFSVYLFSTIVVLSVIFIMETSVAVTSRASAAVEVTELFYSSIATDLDFAVALNSPVGFVPFAITVQTINVAKRNLELQFLGHMVKA